MEKYLLFYVWLLHYNGKKDDDPVVRSLWIHTRTGCDQEPSQVKPSDSWPTLGLEDAQAFQKAHNSVIKPSRWRDIDLGVYL